MRGFSPLSLSYRSPPSADVLIGSWNIKHLGWNNDKAYNAFTHVTNHFDLLAIQELMDPYIGLSVSLRCSPGRNGRPYLGRGTYREHYSFLWRESEVEYIGGTIVFLDHRDVFASEPYSARFQDTLSVPNSLPLRCMWATAIASVTDCRRSMH